MSKHEDRFAMLCNLYCLPHYEREYCFHPDRHWRFDFAWPRAMLAVEIDGGQWQVRGGRHARDTDREKGNEAARLGWRVLHLSGEMLAYDPERWIGMVKGMLEATNAEMAG